MLKDKLVLLYFLLLVEGLLVHLLELLPLLHHPIVVLSSYSALTFLNAADQSGVDQLVLQLFVVVL